MPTGIFFCKFPTIWPLVRDNVPLDERINLFEPVVIFPEESVNVPFTVVLEERVTPFASFSSIFVKVPVPESVWPLALPESKIFPVPECDVPLEILPFAVIVNPPSANVPAVSVNVPLIVISAEVEAPLASFNSKFP